MTYNTETEPPLSVCDLCEEKFFKSADNVCSAIPVSNCKTILDKTDLKNCDKCVEGYGKYFTSSIIMQQQIFCGTGFSHNIQYCHKETTSGDDVTVSEIICEICEE